MTGDAYLSISIVIVYLIIVSFVAKRFGYLHEHTVSEFAVAGRSYRWYMVLFTVLASWIIGAFFTAWVGMAVELGIIAQYAMIYGLGGLVIYYLIAPRIWTWGNLHSLYNLPDFIKLRYNSGLLAIIVAIVGILLNIPWHIIAFKTFGYVVDALTYGAIPFNVGMTVGVLLILAYVSYGGQRTVVTVDFLQGIVSVVLVIGGITFVAYKLFGGYGPIFQVLVAERPDHLIVTDMPYWSSIILAGIIGSYCWLEIFNRIFLAKNTREVRKVAAGAPVILVIFCFTLLTLSAAGSLIPEVAADPEAGFLIMFNMAGGPILLAMAAIVIIAGEMSSLDSQLATNSVVVANNFVKPFKPDMTDKQMIRVMRIAAAAFVISSLFLAMMELPALVYLAIFTYENLVHMFPAIILGALWKRGNTTAALAGICVGIPITVYFTFFPDHLAAFVGSWQPGIVGFAVNVTIYVVVSLLSKPDPRVEALFDELEKEEASAMIGAK